MEEYLRRRKNYSSNKTDFDRYLFNKLKDHRLKDLFDRDFKKDQLYRIFRNLPKPANLHIHHNSFVSYDQIIYTILNDSHLAEMTYLRPNKRSRDDETDRILTITTGNDVPSSWKLVEESKDRILKILPKNFNRVKMKDLNHLGIIFFEVIKNIEFYEKYWDLIINEMDGDNIYYSEIRLKLGGLHEIPKYNQKNFLSIEEELELLEKIYHKHDKRFKIIITYSRCKPDQNKFRQYLRQVIDAFDVLKDKSMIAGFDLVGDEEECSHNKVFLENLLYLRGLKYDLFLHSGEILKNYEQTDPNLLDAILLESKRIGHGINIHKYPELIDLANATHLQPKRSKSRSKSKSKSKNKAKTKTSTGICLEICPLSNYFIWNYQPHSNPGLFLINQLPVTIGNDDPNKFGYVHLAYDYLTIFKYWNLTTQKLKELLINSINYSCLTNSQKNKMHDRFEKDWNKWLKKYDRSD